MKNKFMLILLGLFMTTAVTAQNYSYFDNDVRFPKDEAAVTTLTHFGVYQINENFGFTNYASIEYSLTDGGYGYGQVLLGGYVNINDKLSFYLLAGKESISNDARFASVLYYTTGDAFRAYAFYQRNGLSKDVVSNEWYDLSVRQAIVSKEKNSFYLGVRYMKYYGIGVPVSVRQAISSNDNIYLGFTAYYDIDDNIGGNKWLPTATLAFEFN
jgi:hypothetical protein